MKGIPTVYKNRNYRSRLEARWAVFFDLMGWKYEYEPYDLNGWIPDFALYGAKQETLVEVKPYSRFEEYDVDKIAKARKGTEKEETEILLLGSTIFTNGESSFGWPAIGWLDGESYAVINKGLVGQYGFFHESFSWHDRITGEYGGDGHLCEPDYGYVAQIWNDAGNMVRWEKVT